MNRRITATVVRSVHYLYKCTISPLLGARCKFHPSCSDYAAEAIIAHGIVKGTGLAVLRLCRCHPWSRGGVDAVPGVEAQEKKGPPAVGNRSEEREPSPPFFKK